MDPLFSEDLPPFSWSEAESRKFEFGPKGARLAALPRLWTPPFVLIPASLFKDDKCDGGELLSLGGVFVERLRKIAAHTDRLIVRSSIIGESIWDRGKYRSEVITCSDEDFGGHLMRAVSLVLASAPEQKVSLTIQCHIEARSWGEFGNVLRVSKTRDHWEFSSVSSSTGIMRSRFNTQRDRAASPNDPLDIRPGMVPERLFGSIGAWFNNELLRGRGKRLNCEWVTDNRRIYVVQVDEEDEDFSGVNPLQLRVTPPHKSEKCNGVYLKVADEKALADWDKLSVLYDLWDGDSPQKPKLCFLPLGEIPRDESRVMEILEDDFRQLIGPDGIIVRTSVRSGMEKAFNLPHTECLNPHQAAVWCLKRKEEIESSGKAVYDFAFVSHRFIASKSSAWVRADPKDAMIEIHSLWGLPDALQYCAYDIWEVHVPTETVTDYPNYKSHILVPQEEGRWKYDRVKNEIARNQSISRKEAMDIANRSWSIAKRIGSPCHIMWFVGCVSIEGESYNLPWYWTEAHEVEKNSDRYNYEVYEISDPEDLQKFKAEFRQGSRIAIELKPVDVNLMRDTKFIKSVGSAARELQVPIILYGSTLAHAFFMLRREGATVVPKGEKEHLRTRRATTFGKLVRDEIPLKIAQRQEVEVTREVPDQIKKQFLISKLLEEAMEVRTAETREQRLVELADLYEVCREMAHVENFEMREVVEAADEKKKTSGGFQKGVVLLQTGIVGGEKSPGQVGEKVVAQVLSHKLSGDTCEIPFSFFGFMEIDQPRSIMFDSLGIKLYISLKLDRLELRLSKEPEQLELPLDMAVVSSSSSDDD